MAEPSNGRADVSGFSRTRLAVGIVVVTVLAAAVVVGLARLVEGPDPGSLAYVAEDGLAFRDLSEGSEETVVPWNRRWSDPVLDRPGDRVAFASPDGVQVLDLASGRSVDLAPDGRPVVFDPEGRLVYAKPNPQGRTNLVRVVDGEEQVIVPGGFAGHEGPLLWAADDRYVVRILDRDADAGALFVVDLSSGAPSVDHTIRGAFPLTISPDGREVLYTTGSPGELTVLSLEDLESREVGFRGEFTIAATSPAGVAAVGGRDAAGDAGVWALRGGDREPERLADVQPHALAWARDSSRLFYAIEGGLYEVPVPEGGAKPLDVTVTQAGFLEVVR